MLKINVTLWLIDKFILTFEHKDREWILARDLIAAFISSRFKPLEKHMHRKPLVLMFSKTRTEDGGIATGSSSPEL